MNDNNELDALLATIEAGLETGWYAADVWEESNDKLKAGKAALATLREKLAALEADREALANLEYLTFKMSNVYDNWLFSGREGRLKFNQWLGIVPIDLEVFFRLSSEYHSKQS